MSTRPPDLGPAGSGELDNPVAPPDLGPAGSGELDNPVVPPGLGPASSGTLESARGGKIPIAPPREPQPLNEPSAPQPVAGGKPDRK
ncbi:MAG: hypothetical protein Q8P18_08460 [Pseudomonadota bacterium]|nr:hypothetical protein [Pseudomonadota bacterium]